MQPIRLYISYRCDWEIVFILRDYDIILYFSLNHSSSSAITILSTIRDDLKGYL